MVTRHLCINRYIIFGAETLYIELYTSLTYISPVQNNKIAIKIHLLHQLKTINTPLIYPLHRTNSCCIFVWLVVFFISIFKCLLYIFVVDFISHLLLSPTLSKHRIEHIQKGNSQRNRIGLCGIQ